MNAQIPCAIAEEGSVDFLVEMVKASSHLKDLVFVTHGTAV